MFTLYHYIGWMVYAPVWIEEWNAFRQSWDAYLLNYEFSLGY